MVPLDDGIAGVNLTAALQQKPFAVVGWGQISAPLRVLPAWQPQRGMASCSCPPDRWKPTNQPTHRAAPILPIIQCRWMAGWCSGHPRPPIRRQRSHALSACALQPSQLGTLLQLQ